MYQDQLLNRHIETTLNAATLTLQLQHVVIYHSNPAFHLLSAPLVPEPNLWGSLAKGRGLPAQALLSPAVSHLFPDSSPPLAACQMLSLYIGQCMGLIHLF